MLPTGVQWPTRTSLPLRWSVRPFTHPNIHTAHSIHHFSVNIIEGEPDDRPMTTGQHTVRDIYCIKCNTTLGWKYVSFTPIDLHSRR